MAGLTLTTNATITQAGLVGPYENYFSKEFLLSQINTLVYDQFAMKVPFPKNIGAKTIQFFRRQISSGANVQTLTEGTAIAVFRDLVLETVNVTLGQYGVASRLSDILDMTGLYNFLQLHIKSLGEDAALHADSIIRNVVVAGLTTDAVNRRYSGQTAAAFNTWNLFKIGALSATSFSSTDLLDAFTRLKVNLAPRINGEYVCISPPQVTRDLMNDTKWVTASQYSAVKQLFAGEIGMFYGCRIVEDTQAFQEDSAAATTGTFALTGTPAYTSFITGKNGYGCPAMAGNSPFSPSIIITNTPDSGNPLNQYVTVGWKSYWAALVLNTNFVLQLKSHTQWGG